MHHSPNPVPPPTSRSGQQQSLQVLRAVAATLVVWCHAEALVNRVAQQRPSASYSFSGIGAFGVDIFFVISGAVMMLATEHQFGKSGARSHFLRRRTARIYPPYWLYAGLATLIAVVAGAELKSGYLLESFLLLPVLNGLGKLRPILGVGWTLTYELYFYAIFALALGGRRQHAPWVVAALLGGIALGARLFIDERSAWGMFLADLIVLEFFAGVLLGLWIARLRAMPRWSGPLICLLGFVWWATAGEPSTDMRWISWGAPAVLIVAGALAMEGSGAWRRIPSWLVALGDGSYSLYLLHPVLFTLFSWIAPRIGVVEFVPAELAVALAVLASVVTGYFAYVKVELPLVQTMQGLLFGSRVYKARRAVTPIPSVPDEYR